MILNVAVEIEGSFEQIGQIKTKRAVGGVFRYSNSWIENRSNLPLSISMPLERREFTDRQIKPYFAGLLPEGQALVEVANQFRVTSASYLKILKGLGDECIGAVRIADAEITEKADEPRYEKLSEAEINRISVASYPKSAQVNADAKLSIAGAQSKTGIYIDPDTKDFFLPKNTAPSNWIAKPASLRFNDLIDNEFFCMKLAKCCGLKVAECELSNTETPMLLIKRFDRIIDSAKAEIDGHATFARLHQEDFCQALGIQSEKKYEGQHTFYAKRSGELLRNYSTNIIKNVKDLFKLITFNFLIGNCDAHLKNYSLIRSRDWRELNISPAYDLVSTAVYEELGAGLAMRIGHAKKLQDVTRDSFIQLGVDLILSKNVSNLLLNEFCGDFKHGLNSCEAESKIAEKVKQQSLKRLDLIAPSHFSSN